MKSLPGLIVLGMVGVAGCGVRPAAVGEVTLSVEAPPADPTQAVVVLEGPGYAAVRERLKPGTPQEQLDQVFYLAVRPADGAGPATPVPLLARLEWGEERLRLVPQTSLTPGLAYEAVFEGPRLDPALPRLTETYRVPEEKRTSDARVVALHPNRKALPANLLKFYVHFNRPMAEGKVFQHARLLDGRGEPIDQAFREVELWEDNHQRLTLWINPGRTKRSLGLSESLGPVLEENREYTLELTAGLPDSRGRKLTEGMRHTFHTTGHDRTQPAIATWKVDPPAVASREVLMLQFGEAMDHALAERGIRVRGPGDVQVPGTARLSEDGRQWTFTPAGDWAAGEHAITAAGEIEDLAGNSLYRAFETPAASGKHPSPAPPEYRLAFTIR